MSIFQTILIILGSVAVSALCLSVRIKLTGKQQTELYYFVANTVRWVEQISKWTGYKGSQKLDKAAETVKSKFRHVDAEEIIIMIESEVYKMSADMQKRRQ